MTEKLLAVIFVFIKSVIAVTGYGGITLLMAIESACVPLPSELIMPFAGYLVFEGTFKLLWVATAGAIGCNLGSLVAYEIGCYGGRPLVERYGRWILMGKRELDWADRFFVRWGYLAVFFGRLLPVVRTFIALPAGVARMPRGRFHLYTFLGSWPWCLGLAYLGMKLGENWRELGRYFHKFDAVIGVVLVAGAAWFVWSHWRNRLSSQPSAVSHQPSVKSPVGRVSSVNWTLRLRLLQIACILALLECFRFSRSVRHEWNGKLTLVHWLLIGGAVYSGVSGFRLQRRTVNGPKRRSTSTPFTRWRAGRVARLGTATTVGLYGFCLSMFAGPPLVVNALFALGLVLLLVWTPGAAPDQVA